MSAPPSYTDPAPQLWPCGMDCAFAEERPGTYGEWIWCRRAAAPVRLIRAGRECPFFQAPGTVNDNSLAVPPNPTPHSP